MWSFIKSRAKAIVLPVVLGLTTGLMKGFEAASGFDIPAEQELAIVTWVTGILGTILIERIPNS